MQKVMIMSTSRSDMRSAVEGWTFEDGNQVYAAWSRRSIEGHIETQNQMPVGMILSGRHTTYSTPLHAIGEGWRLLAPPTSYEETYHDMDDKPYQKTMWTWWLVKE